MKRLRKGNREGTKQLRRVIKNCPLLVCILCSWAIFATTEYLPLSAGENQTEEADIQENDGWLSEETEEITTNGMFSGVTAANRVPDIGTRPLHGEDKAAVDAEDGQADDGDAAGDGQTDDEDAVEGGQTDDGNAAGDGQSEEQEQKPQKVKPEYISYEKKKTDSPWYTDPGKIPQTTKYDYQTVKKDYFDDAVFIGDSRIVGMNDYSGLTNATFFAKTGLTIYNLLDDQFVKDPDSGRDVSVSYMMQHYNYGKIYLMVGINELGTGGTQRFQDAYKKVLKSFRKWQPDAVIYVQSIMGVSPSKDQSDSVFNNTNIRDKNYAVSKLTDGIHIFYLNIQEIYEDKHHNLAQELTFDDVHLYAQHYDKWVKYLKKHAVVR